MAYIWSETFSNIKYSGIMGFFSIILVVLNIIVLSILLILANYIQAELSSLKQSPLIVVFLKDDLDDATRQNIQEEINSLPQVKSYKYISKEEALERTKRLFSDRSDVLDGLESINPLPSSFEIELKPQFIGDTREMADKIRLLPGIDDIQHAEKTSQLVIKIQTGLIFVGSILGLSSILIIFFSIMLTAYIRRDEIRIMRLVGATKRFIRIPLLLQGVMQGLIGTLIGLALLYGALILLEPQLGKIPFLQITQIAIIVGSGIFMGFIAGAMPLRKLMRL